MLEAKELEPGGSMTRLSPSAVTFAGSSLRLAICRKLRWHPRFHIPRSAIEINTAVGFL